MSSHLERFFPGLATTSYRVTSPVDKRYNCVAWSLGFTQAWWWPRAAPNFYWPPAVPRIVSLPAFQQMFELHGFNVCADGTSEIGYEKIAVFADAQDTPTHVARQVSDVTWTSKLGHLEDIEHELRALEGTIYGKIVLCMKRPTAALPVSAPAD